MASIVITIHVLVSIALVIIILLQHGKGADVGAVFGGSSQTLFGAGGAGNAAARAPWWAIAVAVSAASSRAASLAGLRETLDIELGIRISSTLRLADAARRRWHGLESCAGGGRFSKLALGSYAQARAAREFARWR